MIKEYNVLIDGEKLNDIINYLEKRGKEALVMYILVDNEEISAEEKEQKKNRFNWLAHRYFKSKEELDILVREIPTIGSLKIKDEDDGVLSKIMKRENR